MNTLKDELHRLYSDASKHSIYQNIPDFVSIELGYTEPIDEAWRGDRPRLAYLLSKRIPAPGEKWVDFGANTGFFTLSLARQYPKTTFIAVEANPNHVRFIDSVAHHFHLNNVETLHRAIGVSDLDNLPQCDFLLHLNVLHHAGHDFDINFVKNKHQFSQYAQVYLNRLHVRALGMLFQIGNNWGGDKSQPLVDMQDDARRLQTFFAWLHHAGWQTRAISYARHGHSGRIGYQDLSEHTRHALIDDSVRGTAILTKALGTFELDRFPGEFYRRPLFLCDTTGVA